MKNKRFKSALSLLLVLLLCFSVMAPSFAAQTVDLAATGADKTMEKHANSATISRAEIIGLFGDSTSVFNTAFYGYAPLPDPGTELDTSTITYVSGTSAIAAGEYLALKTTANGGSTFNRRPDWDDPSKRSQLTLTFKTYYTASFTVTGSGDGALYLNGNSVNGSVNLYTDENYTVTAADVEGFTREVTGVTLGEAFNPTSDMTITAAYTPNASADISLTFSDGGTAKIVSGGIEVEDTIPAGETFSVETNPNTDKGYALDSIAVTKNGEAIEANEDGSYGPAANGDEYTVTVTFKFDPEVVEHEVSATNAVVTRTNLSSYLGSYSYYGIAPEDDPDNIDTVRTYSPNYSVQAGNYYIYATDDNTGGLLPQPVWTNAKLMLLTVRTYYDGTFNVTGNAAGEVYLNNEPVTGTNNVKLYTDTQYTVTAKDVAEYTYTINGAADGEAFTPSANINVTVSYLKAAFATYTLTVGDGGTAQVLVNGEPATDRISEGDSFTVTATPNENAGYKLDSIVVTENGTAIEPNGDGSYGPAVDQAVYAITVSFTYDPPRAEIDVDANNARVTLSNVSGFFNGGYSYYGIAKEKTDNPTYLNILNQNFNVQAGEYFIYGTNDGSALNPSWTNAKLMVLTVRTYYNGAFTVTGHDDGEVYLNGTKVTEPQKLYTDTEYTVTAKAIDGYDYEMTGADAGMAFTPTADVNVTVTYTSQAYATLTLTVGEGGTAQVLVNGEPATDRISAGDSFTVTATPNENAGYKLDSIVVTKNGEAIEANEGVYGPAEDQAVYAITVSFTYDPPRKEIEVDANKGTVSRSDISGFFNDSYSYYGIAKEANDPVEYLYNLLGYENNFDVTDGEYFIYATNDNTGGLLPQPVWDNPKLMILNVKTYYTVTWKNWDDTELDSDHVYNGATPSYDGETPVRPEDMNATYTFSAWDGNGETYLIGEELPPVTGDVTYTAVYTADIKELFVAHSITLGGDIGVNFYIDSNVAGVKDADTAVVKFAWDGGNYIKEVNLKELTPNDKGWLKATVNVVAAQMAHKIEATAFINGNMFTTVDLYSVQDYAKAVYDDPAKYDDKGKPEQLKALAKALLNYGSEAQTVFDAALNVHPDRADSVIANDPADYSGVTADAVAAKINGEASDLNDVASQLNAKYYTNSLIYLQNNTLRVYFTPNEYGQAMPNADAYAGSQSDYYYYAEKTNIPAAQLDNQQEFTVGDVNFYFSPLDYVKAVLSSSKMTDAQKNLAASLFLYNQAANAYFD